MSNPAHGYDRGFPKGGYTVNGSTTTINYFAIHNGHCYSVGKRKREAQIKAIFERLAGHSNSKELGANNADT